MVLLHVFIEIALLCEFLITFVHGANKGFFIIVNAHMVKQIVPFSKQLATPSNIADENLRPAVGLGIEKFNKAELSRLW